MNGDWIVPDWPAPSCVKALITTRQGGVSTGPYASMNLGFTTGDDAEAVDENRRRLRACLPAEPRWLKQVHGTRVVDADTLVERVEADAALARETCSVCAVLVADCLPVLLTDRAGSLVAVAHAGWRGLAGGVIERTVGRLREHSPHDVIAYIGPGIGRDAFEVGADVYRAFTSNDAGAAAAFVVHRPGKWLADLPALARRALAACGVEQVYGGGFCTWSDPRRFFSYRRDGTTGRMAALIWREA
jgi:YfiH family protein